MAPSPVPRVAAGPWLAVGWCAVAVGIAARDGRYGAGAITAVLVGWAAVVVAVAMLGGWPGPAAWAGSSASRAAGRHGRAVRPAGWRVAWYLVAAVVALGPVLRHPLYYGSGPYATAAEVLAVAAGGLTAMGIVTAVHRSRSGPPARTAAGRLAGILLGPAGFVVAVALAAAAGACALAASPQPRIDVFHLLQDSTAGLVDGENMYRQNWLDNRPGGPAAGLAALNGGLVDVYPYLPGTSLLLAPARLLLGDVRYGLLAALVVAAVAVRAVAVRAAAAAGEPGRAGAPVPAWVPALPLLVLVFPEATYALEQSWTEPLLIACLAVAVWAAGTGRGWLAVTAFAAALASKQHVALLVPVAASWPAFGPRRTAAACGLALAVVAPWLFADFDAFWHDAVETNLGYVVLDHSLSVPGWAHHFGVELGFPVTAAGLVGAYLLAWRARGDAAGFAAGAALVLLTTAVLNKQSFFNHYTLPMALLVLAAAACAAIPAPAGGGQPPGPEPAPQPARQPPAAPAAGLPLAAQAVAGAPGAVEREPADEGPGSSPSPPAGGGAPVADPRGAPYRSVEKRSSQAPS
ncbi:MAG: glycosyltransferase [Frankia sp.]|nr:glycosyltransferase [Frankia sp.]